MAYVCHFNRIKSYPIQWPLTVMGLKWFSLCLYACVRAFLSFYRSEVCQHMRYVHGSVSFYRSVVVSFKKNLFGMNSIKSFAIRTSERVNLFSREVDEFHTVICLHSYFNESKCTAIVYIYGVYTENSTKN